jgi:HKD family nuclease
MPLTKLLAREWKSDLALLFGSVNAQLVISSPYVTSNGTSYLLSHLPRARIDSISLRFVTDLSAVNIYQGSTDPEALRTLADNIPNLKLLHLPKLHAKVYVSDYQNAIVTSANLTEGGLDRNYEYGISTDSTTLVRQILEDITEYSDLGAPVTRENLIEYCKIAERLRTSFKKKQFSIRSALQKEFDQSVLSAEDNLIRLRLAGGAMHTVFAKTIMYLLRRYGPMQTVDIHPKIQQIHPDLCDDNIDRIIEGKRFGKKWKHAVRTAQQQLKKQGIVRFSDGHWEIIHI